MDGKKTSLETIGRYERVYSAEINSIYKFKEVERNNTRVICAVSPLREMGDIFHIGVLTELKEVNGTIIARISDMYGAYTLIANSTYQPLPYSVLKNIGDLPQYVAVVGKIRPKKNSNGVFVKPTFVTVVSKKERELWEKEAKEITLKRVKEVGNTTEKENLIKVFREKGMNV